MLKPPITHVQYMTIPSSLLYTIPSPAVPPLVETRSCAESLSREISGQVRIRGGVLIESDTRVKNRECRPVSGGATQNDPRQLSGVLSLKGFCNHQISGVRSEAAVLITVSTLDPDRGCQVQGTRIQVKSQEATAQQHSRGW